MFTTPLRWQLLLPPVLPAAAFLAAIHAFDEQGTVTDRHNSIGMLILLFFLLPIAAAVEMGALGKALPILFKDPKSRSVGNVLCVAVGISFLACCIWAVFWAT